MTTFFTMGKLKLVSGAMKESILDFCTSIRADCNFAKGSPSVILVDRKYEALYLDLSFRSAFGIKIDDHLNPSNEILKIFRELNGHDNAEVNFMYTLTSKL